MECERWLKDRLKDKEPVLCEVIKEEAKTLGYKKSELRAARHLLGVKAYHQLNADGDNHFWYLEVQKNA